MSTDSNSLKLAAGMMGRVIENKKINLLYHDDNGIVVYTARMMAERAGFKTSDEFMIATAASELATNILRYAGKGEFEISIIKDMTREVLGIELFACDRGPGIENIEQVMQEQFSSLPNSLGLGLPSVKRIMDEFYIESIPGKGTRVLARKWRENGH